MKPRGFRMFNSEKMSIRRNFFIFFCEQGGGRDYVSNNKEQKWTTYGILK